VDGGLEKSTFQRLTSSNALFGFKIFISNLFNDIVTDIIADCKTKNINICKDLVISGIFAKWNVYMLLSEKLVSKIPLSQRDVCQRQTGCVNSLLIEGWQLN
jgi:hypothetical protein